MVEICPESFAFHVTLAEEGSNSGLTFRWSHLRQNNKRKAHGKLRRQTPGSTAPLCGTTKEEREKGICFSPARPE